MSIYTPTYMHRYTHIHQNHLLVTKSGRHGSTGKPDSSQNLKRSMHSVPRNKPVIPIDSCLWHGLADSLVPAAWCKDPMWPRWRFRKEPGLFFQIHDLGLALCLTLLFRLGYISHPQCTISENELGPTYPRRCQVIHQAADWQSTIVNTTQ